MAIAGLRSLIAAAFIIILVKGNLRFNFSWTQTTGAFAYALAMILFVTATKKTTAANAILLQYTSPVPTALLGYWMLKEKVTRFDWMIIAIVLGGMFLFFVGRLTPTGIYGNILAISSGIAMSYFVVSMRLQKNTSTFETVVLGNLLTAVLAIPFYFQSAPSGTEWLILLYMGIFQLGLSFFIFSSAIKHVSALESILIQTLDPLLNPLWVWLVIGEVPGKWALLGGAIVVTAVTYRSIRLGKIAAEKQKTSAIQ